MNTKKKEWRRYSVFYRLCANTGLHQPENKSETGLTPPTQGAAKDGNTQGENTDIKIKRMALTMMQWIWRRKYRQQKHNEPGKQHHTKNLYTAKTAE